MPAQAEGRPRRVGIHLADPEGVLEEQGPNTRAARRITFTSVGDVARLATTVAAYLAEAVDVAEAGLEVAPPPEPVRATELQHRLGGEPALEAAFDALTAGRQREYNLYVSGAKRAETRVARVGRCVPRILAGKGLRDS